MPMTPERWQAERPHLPWPLVSAAPSSIMLEQIYDPKYWRVKSSNQPIHGGFVLPPFQRPPVWDDVRRARYVESLHLRLHGSPIIWNDADEAMGDDGDAHPTDGWLIDGQQRIGAILAYINDGLEVFTDGEFSIHRHRWSDLNCNEKGVFSRLQIPTVRLISSDPVHLREIYVRMAYGGVPHDEATCQVADAASGARRSQWITPPGKGGHPGETLLEYRQPNPSREE